MLVAVRCRDGVGPGCWCWRCELAGLTVLSDGKSRCRDTGAGGGASWLCVLWRRRKLAVQAECTLYILVPASRCQVVTWVYTGVLDRCKLSGSYFSMVWLSIRASFCPCWCSCWCWIGVLFGRAGAGAGAGSAFSGDVQVLVWVQVLVRVLGLDLRFLGRAAGAGAGAGVGSAAVAAAAAAAAAAGSAFCACRCWRRCWVSFFFSFFPCTLVIWGLCRCNLVGAHGQCILDHS